MWDIILSWFFSWIGITGVVALCAFAVAMIFPQFRATALIVAGGALGAAALIAKGRSDQAALEKKRREEAVARARQKYTDIERKRADETDEEFLKRLDEGKWGGR